MNDVFSKIVDKIIREQESIIGPIALEQAKKVPGLKVDMENNKISIEGNKTVVVETLVEQYKDLFGQASVQACKDAVKGIISDMPIDQVPALLR